MSTSCYVCNHLHHARKNISIYVKFVEFKLDLYGKQMMDKQIKVPLLPNDLDENEVTRHPTKRKLYNYWQRRKEAWIRKKQASNPCRLGFNCLILIWSILALVTTLLSYFRLIQLLKDGHDKLR